MSAPNKGPQWKYQVSDPWAVGCQEEYENDPKHVGVDAPGLDPFSLKASDSDHTPNYTREPKKGKPGYGKFQTGEVGL